MMNNRIALQAAVLHKVGLIYIFCLQSRFGSPKEKEKKDEK